MTHWPGCCAMKKSTAMWYGCSVRHAASTRRPRRPCRRSSKMAMPGLLAGNAPHDLEGSLLHGAGADIYTQESRPNAYTTSTSSTPRGLQAPFRCSSNRPSGCIMHACVARRAYVPAGSIRDDGPLPGVCGDVRAQNAMRERCSRPPPSYWPPAAYHCHGQYDAFLLCAAAGHGQYTVLWISEFVTNKPGQGQPSSVPIGQCTGLFVPRGRRARLAGCGKI
ncbi:MAG: hypothetical protein ACLR7U_08495 [Ruthenibacterium lactatiformans]